MATRVVMPQVGITTTEGLIGEWYKNEGEYVQKGEPLFSLETDKVTTDVEATADGVLRKIIIPAGEMAPVTATVAIIGELEEDITPLLKEAGLLVDGPADNEKERVKISPRARKIAMARGISEAELATIQGSGPENSIVEADIEAYLEKKVSQEAANIQKEVPVPEAVVTDLSAKVTMADKQGKVEPLSRMRKIIARRMLQSHQEVPPFYLKMEVQASQLLQLRAELNRGLNKKETPIKLSLTDFFIKASALALRDYPGLNVTYTDEGIIYHREINIGVAAAVADGLIVPVIKNADARSLYQIARERVNLIRKARDGELNPEEISGGTFTVSNLGMYGVDEFIAIINPPEAAILAIGSLKDKLYLAEGMVQVRQCFTMGLTVDHRAVDGALAARFLKLIKENLEDPYGLLLY